MYRYNIQVFNVGSGSKRVKGIVYGENIVDAVRQLAEYYGEEDITTINELYRLDNVLEDDEMGDVLDG